jgi:hypothetical protein
LELQSSENISLGGLSFTPRPRHTGLPPQNRRQAAPQATIDKKVTTDRAKMILQGVGARRTKKPRTPSLALRGSRRSKQQKPTLNRYQYEIISFNM